MNNSINTVKLAGRTHEFTALSGVVIETGQRSDTLVGSSTSGSAVTISSRVAVTTKAWVRDANGKEHDLQINADVPLRAGQIVHAIYCGDATPFCIFNSTTGKWYHVGGIASLAPGALSLLLRSLLFIGIGFVLIVAWTLAFQDQNNQGPSIFWGTALLIFIVGYYFVAELQGVFTYTRRIRKFRSAFDSSDDVAEFFRRLESDYNTVAAQAI